MRTPNFANYPNYFLIITAACIFLILILGVGLVFPKNKELTILKASIENKQKMLQQEKEYFLGISQAKVELENYSEVLSKIDSALPDNPSMPSLLNFLQKASSQSGLVLKSISPFTISSSKESTSVNIKQVQISLTVVGSYSSFKNFISILEKSARLIEIENVSFTSSKEGDLFNFNLRVKTHSY